MEGPWYVNVNPSQSSSQQLTMNMRHTAVFYNRFAGRTALLDYAAEKGIPVFQTAAKPWSTG